MRVFVSSTIYDLLDIRSEVESLLRGLGITPVMSDHNSSDFKIALDANSIETCLLNVDASNAVIVILDKRYGPRLGQYGFDNVSATHLEYRRAKASGIPIYFYVRDRLEADFNIQKKNKPIDDLILSWISPDNKGLLEFLEEHRSLCQESSESNWFSLFSTSQDLKASIRRHFEPVILPETLLEAVQQNRFPMFTQQVDADRITIGGVSSIKCKVTLKNIGQVPAFDLICHWQLDGQKPEKTILVPPGEEVSRTLLANLAFGTEIDAVHTIEYRAAIGITVRERYRIYCLLQGGMAPSMLSGGTLIERTYHKAPRPSLVIQAS